MVMSFVLVRSFRIAWDIRRRTSHMLRIHRKVSIAVGSRWKPSGTNYGALFIAFECGEKEAVGILSLIYS